MYFMNCLLLIFMTIINNNRSDLPGWEISWENVVQCNPIQYNTIPMKYEKSRALNERVINPWTKNTNLYFLKLVRFKLPGPYPQKP